MRFGYSTSAPGQDEFDRLPRLPLILHTAQHQVEAVGLVDSGATVNVLPYEVGVRLGVVWDDSQATIRLGGALGNVHAMPVFLVAEVDEFPPVRLAFAWVKDSDVPLILGQTNFFMEFDVCFYRSRFEFEVFPKSS